jgi:hypothetical protein
VKYRSGAAFRQALEQRLLTRSRDRGISLVRLRKAVVFDRFLVRLAIAAPGRWVLKGALALDFRLGERTRTTKEMDLVRRDNEAAATSDLIAAQVVDLDDFFTFDIEKVRAPGETLEGVAVRYRVRAELGGRRFEEVMVDIGFSDPLGWTPETIRAPDLLAFADIEPIEVPIPRSNNTSRRRSTYTPVMDKVTRAARKRSDRSCPRDTAHGAGRGAPSQCTRRSLRGKASTRSSGSPPSPANGLGGTVPKAGKGGRRRPEPTRGLC